MYRKAQKIFLGLILSILLTISIIPSVFAAVSPGGGCVGDCTPPPVGVTCPTSCQCGCVAPHLTQCNPVYSGVCDNCQTWNPCTGSCSGECPTGFRCDGNDCVVGGQGTGNPTGGSGGGGSGGGSGGGGCTDTRSCDSTYGEPCSEGGLTGIQVFTGNSQAPHYVCSCSQAAGPCDTGSGSSCSPSNCDACGDSGACSTAGCNWCGACQSQACGAPPITPPVTPPAPGACTPAVNLAVVPNNPAPGADITVTASSTYGYGNINLDSSSGITNLAYGGCNPCDPNNAAWSWTGKAGGVGSYPLKFTGSKDQVPCTSTTTLNVVAPVGCSSSVALNVDPANPLPGAQVTYTASSGAAYTSTRMVIDGAAPVDVSCTSCAAPTYTWVLITTAPAAGEHAVKFTSIDCNPAEVRFTVGTPVSSLTKEVAKQLLYYTERIGAENDFTLFCDMHSKALNYHSYSSQGENVDTVLTTESAGNVCVLKTGGDVNPKVVFGAPLKVKLSDSNSKVLKVLKENCQASIKGETVGFKECEASKKVWHKKTVSDNGIVIYGNDKVELTTASDEYLRPVADFIRKIFLLSGTAEAVNFVSSAEKLDRVYVSSLNGKRISGMIDTVGGQQRMVIEYSGFTSRNPCSILNPYFNKIDPAIKQPLCEDVASDKHVIRVDCTGPNQKVCDSWIDLTAKSRLQ